LNNLNLPHNYNKSCTNDYDATATKSELIEAILWGLEILFWRKQKRFRGQEFT